jgi:hypothetical protein
MFVLESRMTRNTVQPETGLTVADPYVTWLCNIEHDRSIKPRPEILFAPRRVQVEYAADLGWGKT